MLKKVDRRSYLKYLGTGVVGFGLGTALGYGASALVGRRATPLVEKEIIALSKVPSAVEASIDWKQCAGETITVVDLPYERFKGFDNLLIPEFERLTGIKINLLSYGDEELLTKTLTEARGKGTSIDSFFIDAPVMPQFLELDAIEPLEPLIEDASVTDEAWLDLDDFYSGVIDICSSRGELYALASCVETTAIAFRKSVVEEYMGTDFVKKLRGGPTSGITYDEFKEAIEAVHMYDGKTPAFNTRHTGNVYGGIDYDPWSTLNWAFGGKGVLDPVTKHPWLDTPEQEAALQWMQDVMTNYTMPGSQNWFVDEGYKSVFDSQTVFSYFCTSLFSVACFDPKETKDYGDWGIGTLPIGPAGVDARRAYIWEALDVINKNIDEKKKKAAWLWIQFKHSKDAETLATFLYLQSARKSAYEDPNVQRVLGPCDDFGQVYQDTMNNFAKKHYYGIYDAETDDYLPELAAIVDIIGPELNAAAFSLKTPKEALKSAQEKVDKLMRQKGYY